MADNERGEMVFLGGLWLNEAKDGSKFMSGGFGLGGKILVFKNTKKTKQNEPDYNMFIVQKPRDPNSGQSRQGQNGEFF